MRVFPGVHWSLSFRVNVCTLYQYLLRPVTVRLYLVRVPRSMLCHAINAMRHAMRRVSVDGARRIRVIAVVGVA